SFLKERNSGRGVALLDEVDSTVDLVHRDLFLVLGIRLDGLPELQPAMKSLSVAAHAGCSNRAADELEGSPAVVILDDAGGRVEDVARVLGPAAEELGITAHGGKVSLQDRIGDEPVRTVGDRDRPRRLSGEPGRERGQDEAPSLFSLLSAELGRS